MKTHFSTLSLCAFFAMLNLPGSAGAQTNLDVVTGSAPGPATLAPAISPTPTPTPSPSPSPAPATTPSGAAPASDLERLKREIASPTPGTPPKGAIGLGPGLEERRPTVDISSEAVGPESVTLPPKSVPAFSLETPMTEPGAPQSLKDIGKSPTVDLSNPASAPENVTKPANNNTSPALSIEGGPVVPSLEDNAVAPGAVVAPSPAPPASGAGTAPSGALPPAVNQGTAVPSLDP